MLFDIVIPLGPNEVINIYNQIEYTRKNVKGYRNIYIVTDTTKNFNLKLDDCIIIDESIFPFKMDDIANYFYSYNGKNNRNGWYLQQLIKLYSGFIIENILDNYLVIDADVFFLKPIEFFEDSKYIFTTSNEYHIPYFDHMKTLHPSFIKEHTKSGISHHMIFNKYYIREMFDLVENFHQDGRVFWRIFIESVKEHLKYPSNCQESGASEYEMYFNYMLKNYSDIIKIRQLDWENVSVNFNLNNKTNYDYVSLCSYIRY
jgi:hypothetical protein